MRPPAYPAITSSSVVRPIDTASLFQANYSEPGLSPIDQYIENNKPLNVIAGSSGLTQEAASIVLLGYMSAVESYLRAVLRAAITIDEYSQRLVENMDICYAAAVHHQGHLMPDALFERMSLANPDNIKDAIKSFIGIKGNLPNDVKKVLDEFSKVCELRHCCVHRFGKLGAKNAVSLGMVSHNKLLEKPLHLNSSSLEDISFLLRSLVNTINRFIYESLLNRMANNRDDQGRQMYSENWTWNYTRDRKRFVAYYNIFSTKTDSPPSPDPKVIYDVYRSSYRAR